MKKNCTSKERGGGISVFESSGLILIRTTIYSSKSNFGGLFYFQENYKIPIQIIACSFFTSYGIVNLIDTFNSYVRLSDITFQNNSNNIFGISYSTFETQNITIKNHICYASNQGCLLSGNSLSKILLNKIKLVSLTSKISAGNIFLEQASIQIMNSEFDSSQTSKSMGSCMLLQNSTANITFSKFKNFSINCIYSILNGYLQIDQSVFDDKAFNSQKNVEFGVLVCSSCSLLSIKNCNFSGGSGSLYGGAISIVANYFFSTKYEIRIENNYISENLANLKGGALYLYNVNATIINNTFSKNMAESGGAVFFDNQG